MKFQESVCHPCLGCITFVSMVLRKATSNKAAQGKATSSKTANGAPRGVVSQGFASTLLREIRSGFSRKAQRLSPQTRAEKLRVLDRYACSLSGAPKETFVQKVRQARKSKVAVQKTTRLCPTTAAHHLSAGQFQTRAYLLARGVRGCLGVL